MWIVDRREVKSNNFFLQNNFNTDKTHYLKTSKQNEGFENIPNGLTNTSLSLLQLASVAVSMAVRVLVQVNIIQNKYFTSNSNILTWRVKTKTAEPYNLN